MLTGLTRADFQPAAGVIQVCVRPTAEGGLKTQERVGGHTRLPLRGGNE